MDKSGYDGHDPEAQGNSWDIITRSDNLAQHIRWNFEDNVRNVENAQDSIVIVILETEILFEASQFGVSDVGTIDKAEQVEEGDSGDNVKVDLPPKSAFGGGIEVNERIAVSDEESKWVFATLWKMKKTYLSVAPTPLSATS